MSSQRHAYRSGLPDQLTSIEDMEINHDAIEKRISLISREIFGG